ncbi:MAG: tRNA 2-selenouridine(34) synthase MnmH [Flavobacteriales bacterium]|nr:tRNA 2-selenouridine(34) synthase MnmH [Flavobacteriales bacterium]MCB0807795.1 tRNA 2-selenouridine(34) synthase MnmH [Flavobacteriales bacterium]MCB0811749.1 tRNA 2-selenouridine(34) synthase MnmH [Flavobacteriales bacterium]MCB9181613.1 tRNA 2-selenouridine(34) synthase MnmH [Flavobacteriales bacterium]MCB9200023.1 tRNA 2-selenouridine(34) synthase MnmH [Flavobacteriales bacterium]
MVRPTDISEFLASGLPVLDVRSPGEYAKGHVPGSTNMPLFTDEERAVVGTLYKQQGRDAAVLEGLRIVGPKLAGMVAQARERAPDGHVAVHCWRGGERSGSVAWLLDKSGFPEVITLRGGYKAFRRHVLGSFEMPLPLRVLGGYTGTGKTELLGLLRDRGEQVVDLEALASHKGSAFGALGEAPQPTTEHFENRLWAAFSTLDKTREVWVEDESRHIGRVALPDALFRQLREAPLLFVDRPIDVRADRLVKDYGTFDRKELAAAVERIRKRLGPQHCKNALEALEAGDLRAVALITLRYYDKSYAHGAAQRNADRVFRIEAAGLTLEALVDELRSRRSIPSR